MKVCFIAVLLLALVAADNWAILVAGSEGFYNYRHQADVAHAYQILKKGGIPADHIITMMVDDIVNDPKNPFPGELYNHPGDDVPNVYEGVVIDYKGKENNVDNFLKILVGDESAGGKVLKSNENDNVFLFFSDHGGPNVLCFPESDLGRRNFHKVLNQMVELKMFKHFVIYIEACYSGSIGIDFPEDLGITFVTAANEQESSWGWYCGEEAVVKGKTIGTCLGDEFSVFWMEDTDKGEQKTETLEEQWNRIHAGVTKSHASRYGDISFASDLIGEYVGYFDKSSEKSFTSKTKTYSEAWDSRDNKVLYYRHMYLHSSGAEKKEFEKLYLEEVSLRQQIDRYFNSIAKEDKYYEVFVGDIKSDECYEAGVAQLEGIFGRTDYQFKYYNVIANMCNENPLVFSRY